MTAIGTYITTIFLKQARKNAYALFKGLIPLLHNTKPHFPKTFIISTHNSIFFKQTCTKINEKH